jgi:hypothetical protein
MKQTAVEWLEEQIICQQNIYIDLAKKNKLLKKQVDAILTATTLLKMKCKQAKEMEKQQIIDAYDKVSMNTALEYYKETFNK